MKNEIKLLIKSEKYVGFNFIHPGIYTIDDIKDNYYKIIILNDKLVKSQWVKFNELNHEIIYRDKNPEYFL